MKKIIQSIVNFIFRTTKEKVLEQAKKEHIEEMKIAFKKKKSREGFIGAAVSNQPKRKLVENVKTGKFEWTEGEKPFVDGPEVLKEVMYDSTVNSVKLVMENLEGAIYQHNRWILNFPGIHSFLIRSFDQLDDTTSKFSVILMLPGEDYDIVEVLKSIDKNKEKTEIETSLELLDPTGVVVKVIGMKKCKVLSVQWLDRFEYGNDGFLTATIVYNHEKRIIK